MRGDIYSGWLTLSSFPCTLNKELDPTHLKPSETPEAYGINADTLDVLSLGTCPIGTARPIVTKTVTGTTHNWYFNRLWAFSSTTLRWYAPYYDDMAIRQDLGRVTTDAAITEILPFSVDDMLVITATGSHVLSNCSSESGNFAFSRFLPELYASGTTKVVTLDGQPFVSNAAGIFSLADARTVANGSVKEWTRNVRNNLGSFSDCAILANYTKKWIIGTSKFVIDVSSGTLLDYGTAGFRFTSRTLTADRETRPFEVESIGLVYCMTTGDSSTITWQSKCEDGDWKDEKDIECRYTEGKYSRLEQSLIRATTCQRFAMRIIDLPPNVKIREIQINVGGYAIGAATT